MQLFAPAYYKNFKCTASKCRHSCCINWEIDIDKSSIKRYKSLNSDYKDTLISSIYTEKTEGVSHFKLKKDGKCPHLNDVGLCKIIIELGEDYLCDICREHPRFYNYTSRGCEVGIGAVCEEACKIILESDSYSEIESIGEAKENAPPPAYDAAAERERIYSILSDKSTRYENRLSEIRNMYKISLDAFSDDEWQCTLSELEYIEKNNATLFECYSSTVTAPAEREIYLERFLAYLIYRHASEAKSERDFRKALAFSLFCERLFASLVKAVNPKSQDELINLARIISMEIEYSTENKDSILIDMEFII
jgi:lysine-N-methylase